MATTLDNKVIGDAYIIIRAEQLAYTVMVTRHGRTEKEMVYDTYNKAKAAFNRYRRKEEKNMKNSKSEAQKYAEGIAKDLNRVYESGKDADGEECDIFEYVANSLDIEYTTDSSFNYIGCRIWVTIGGPSCWLDTRDGVVRCSWGTDKGEAWLPREICDAIDDVCGEYFACR